MKKNLGILRFEQGVPIETLVMIPSGTEIIGTSMVAETSFVRDEILFKIYHPSLPEVKEGYRIPEYAIIKGKDGKGEFKYWPNLSN